jgi:small ligand-binding sensory domain FIST
MPFAAAISEHPDAAHAIGEVAGQLLDALGPAPDLAALFVTAPHVDAVADIAGALRTIVEPECLIGVTANAVVAADRGVEDRPAVAAWAARLAHAVTPMRLTANVTPDGWVIEGLPPEATTASTMVMLVDPFSFPASDVLEHFGANLPALAVIGGLASAARGPGGNRLVLDDCTYHDGAIGLLLDASNAPSTVVSQGCRPIGRPYTVTKADGALLVELGGRPALERLMEIVDALSPEDRALAAQGLHCGIVVDEHKLDFERGDFLIRNVMGADRDHGIVGIGDHVPVGGTIQFQVRDPDSAGLDLAELISVDAERRGPADGMLMFTCNGRGSAMFGDPHHDARTVQEAVGPVPLAGMFCAGELGPVGSRNAVHGFTASLAVFRDGHA